MSIDFAGLSDRGLVRAQNEDCWLADPQQSLFIVADGMGAHNAGELASKMTVEGLPVLLETQPLRLDEPRVREAARTLETALSDLSLQVYEHGRDHPGQAGMGATVVTVVIRGPRALIGHLGDSRVYCLRDGHLRALTHDHSVVRYLVDLGEISEEEARRHPARNQISRYVGMSGEVLPDVSCVELQSRDRLLLCSDGLTEMLTETEIVKLLSAHTSPIDACEALVVAANAAGGTDNVTVLIVDWNTG